MITQGPIGIFDSGIGGLTVTGAILHALPGESTIYFGDTARVPYGPKSPETVRRYSLEILHWLVGQGVKLVTIACNTSTAHALESLRAVSPVPVIGVIEPGGARRGARLEDGTDRGDRHRRHHRERCIHPRHPRDLPRRGDRGRRLSTLRPPGRGGVVRHPATELVAREYLAPMITAKVDTLVLGCTHYPLLKPLLARVMGPGVQLIDSAEETARAVASLLTERKITQPAGCRGDAPVRRKRRPHPVQSGGVEVLGERLSDVEVVSVERS